MISFIEHSMTSSYHANFFNLSIIQEPLVLISKVSNSNNLNNRPLEKPETTTSHIEQKLIKFSLQGLNDLKVEVIDFSKKFTTAMLFIEKGVAGSK